MYQKSLECNQLKKYAILKIFFNLQSVYIIQHKCNIYKVYIIFI